MKRIIAFGCSNTYGEGLEDCVSEDLKQAGQEPSKMAWPSLVGKELNVPVINLAVPGNSNYGIMNNVINFDWQYGDVALILFTYFNRYTIYNNDNLFLNITPNSEIGPVNKVEEFYDMFSNNHLQKFDTDSIDHIFYFLQYYNINHRIRMTTNHDHVRYSKLSKVVHENWQHQLFKENWQTCRIDAGIDIGKHAGPLSHQKFADTMTKILR